MKDFEKGLLRFLMRVILILSFFTYLAGQEKKVDYNFKTTFFSKADMENHLDEWPYKKWKSAKAYTFNFFEIRYPTPLYAYNDKDGWNPNIRSEVDLAYEQADRALLWIKMIQGSMEMSKCPFPRHGVVFFGESGEPVGSVNVCFECGDILVWPEFIEDENKDFAEYSEARLETYDHVFSLWLNFFQDELQMPIDWKAKNKY